MNEAEELIERFKDLIHLLVFVHNRYEPEEFNENDVNTELDTLLDEVSRESRKEMWDELALGGLVCGTKDMRKGCIQCQTEYEKWFGKEQEEQP